MTELERWQIILGIPKGDNPVANEFGIKDSGKRAQFESGMVRDTQEGKLDYWRVFIGPMIRRWADHVTKGAVKYPDVNIGVPNWTLAAGEAELHRFKASAIRHLVQWLEGNVDEDHAAAVIFNINGAEYVKEKMASTPVTQAKEEILVKRFTETTTPWTR